MIKFSQKEKQIGERALKKILRVKNKYSAKWLLINFGQLLETLGKEEKDLIKKILSINPKKEFNKKKIFFGFKPVPKNLVLIKNQKYKLKSKIKTVKMQFLPKDVYLAYQKLNQAMQKEIGQTVNVLSGYRSPAYQMYVFLLYLKEYKWSIRKTIKRVALPGYSEHSYPPQQAIDFAPAKGIAELNNFYKTKEYKWLKKNAHKFGFFLSFPPDNKTGTIFEPWHWHFSSNHLKPNCNFFG